ncbi:hypothetical protein [Lysinibacillus sp. 54212]|uniref:hypothetical protein n=1 Tax=Lysinibacillus sp. 54212 TaxID=3119829 RepID=UPI002FC9F2CF
MNKKWTLSIISAIVGIVLLSGCSVEQGTENDKERSNVSQQLISLATGQAKFPLYKDLDELENTADTIVQVKFTGDRKIQNFEQNGIVIDSAAESEVKVKKVYKGNIEKGSTIVIYEPGFMKGEIYQNVDGYKNMNVKGNYILFLKENPDNTFVGLGVYQGKFDLDITDPVKQVKLEMTKEEFESLDYVGEDPSHFNLLKEEVIQKYKNK